MAHDYHSEGIRQVGIDPGPAVIVTGAAGFIGSHLVERLLSDGYRVGGLDNLDPWYSPALKRANVAAAGKTPGYRFEAVDLLEESHQRLVARFRGAKAVYHLAGRPGVQASWGDDFADTLDQNVLATQRVLEAARDAGVSRVVLASSSSVYGDSAADGSSRVAPVSPYGASKAAAEHLAGVYGRQGLDVVMLRYFTVFGPRQRPDMAFNRLFAACLDGPAFRRRGDGTQRREFTFVTDVVAATVAAGTAPADRVAGRAFDVGGGVVTSLSEVTASVAVVSGVRPRVLPTSPGAGDPRLTMADLGPTTEALGWRPTTSLSDGLAAQWAWQYQLAPPVEPTAIARAS